MGRYEGTEVTSRIEISPEHDVVRDGEIVQNISNWLIDQGLVGGDFEKILAGLCERISAVAGVPLQRAMTTMRTLHPSVDATIDIWNRGGDIYSENFTINQQEDSSWRKSPVYFLLTEGGDRLRRRLEDPDIQLDFPILDELKADGATDYLAYLKRLRLLPSICPPAPSC